MSKFLDLEQSKYAMTERKATRGHLPDSPFDRDYQLERQYLDKLRTQRIKTEKLFEEYTHATKELKRERETTSKLKFQLEELRAKITEMESSRSELESSRSELRRVQSQWEQQKVQISALLADKGVLLKKVKEVEGQVTVLHSLRAEQEGLRIQVQQLEDELAEARQALRNAAKEHQEQAETLRERNLELERSTIEATRELKKEKEAREALRTRSEQDKDRWQQLMLEKTSAFEKLIANYEEQLQIKEQTYSKVVADLQESSKYWSGKYEEKSREAQQLKKAADDHRESLRRGREELEGMRVRLQEKQRKYETLQKDLSESYTSIREKEEELLRMQKSVALAGEKQSGRVRQLQQQNLRLKEWVEQYEGFLQQRRRRELQHKELLEDELEQISKFEKIFKSIE